MTVRASDTILQVNSQALAGTAAALFLVVFILTVFLILLCVSKQKPKKRGNDTVPSAITFSQGGEHDLDLTAPQSPLMKTITMPWPVEAYEMKAKMTTPCTLRRQEVSPGGDGDKKDTTLLSTPFLRKPWHTIGPAPGSRAQIYNHLMTRSRANTPATADRSSVLSKDMVDAVDGGLAMSLQTIPQVISNDPNELSLQRSNTLDLDLSLFSSKPFDGFLKEDNQPALFHTKSMDAIMRNSPRRYENLVLSTQSDANPSDGEDSLDDTTGEEDEEDFSVTGPLRVESQLNLGAANPRSYENILSTPEDSTNLDNPALSRRLPGAVVPMSLTMPEKSKTPVYMNLQSPAAQLDEDIRISADESFSENVCKVCAADLSDHFYINAMGDLHHPSCRYYENVPVGVRRRLSAAGQSGYEEPMETVVMSSPQVETLSGIAVALVENTNDYSHLKRQSMFGGNEQNASEENGYSHLPTVASVSNFSHASNSSEETLAYDHIPMHPNSAKQQQVIEGDYAELDQQRVKSHDYDELPAVETSRPTSRPSSARSVKQQEPGLLRVASQDTHSDYGSDCGRQDSQSALTSSGQETDATPYSSLTPNSDKQEATDSELNRPDRKVIFSTEVPGSLDRHGKAAQGVYPLRKMSEPIVSFHSSVRSLQRVISTPEVPTSPRPQLMQPSRPVIEISERTAARPLDLLAEAAHSYATADETPLTPPQVPTSPQRPLHMITRRPSVEIGSVLGTNDLESVGSMGDLSSPDVSAASKSSDGLFQSPSRDQFGLSPGSNYKELSPSPLGSSTDLTLPTTRF